MYLICIQYNYKMLKLYIVLFSFVNIIRISQAMNESNVGGKVIAGLTATIRQFPHAVFLKMKNNLDQSVVICGSSVLNQLFLISVAHCFDGLDRKAGVVAYAGHEDLDKTKIMRRVVKTVLHERYSIDTSENDIAILKLHRELPLGSNVKRILIKNTFPVKGSGSLAGWGLLNEEPYEKTTKLQSVKQVLWDYRSCRILGIVRGMFCAGSEVHTAPRPARGDSGSGLVTKNHQLVGLLSYKLTKYPALPVYTNVSYYYNWIIKKIYLICKK